jgi:hypothetical protein
LSTHVRGAGGGEALSAGSEEGVEVERGDAGEKWLGSRTLVYGNSALL